jgi:SAM-dependent methyltransferase
MDASQSLSAEYSAKSADYARHWSPVIRPMALPLLPALPLKSAARVLDIGAGTGALLGDLKDAAPDATVIGVDRAEGMLRLVQRSGRWLLTVTDAQSLGIRSETIDVAVLIFVLFHLPPRAEFVAAADEAVEVTPRALRETARRSRPECPPGPRGRCRG